MSLVVAMISVYCGLYFLSEVDQEYLSANPEIRPLGTLLKDSTKMFFFILIVISNSIFFIYWIILMFQQFRIKFRSNYERLYLRFCLCKNRRELEREKRKQKILDQNSLLKEDYFNIIKELKVMYEEGHIVLNKRAVSRFKNYVADEKIFNAIGMVNVYEFRNAEKNSRLQGLFNIGKRKKKVKIGDETNIGFEDHREDSMMGSEKGEKLKEKWSSESKGDSEGSDSIYYSEDGER